MPARPLLASGDLISGPLPAQTKKSRRRGAWWHSALLWLQGTTGFSAVDAQGQDTPTLRTARLVMRAPDENDIPAWFARATDRESAFLAGDPVPANISEGEDWLARARAKAAAGERLVWGIDVLKGPSCVGSVGLNVRKPAISFVIGRAYWRRGYATEAARAALRYGFDVLGLTEIESEFVAANHGSRRVHAKLGFQHIGNFIDEADGAECEQHVLHKEAWVPSG